MKDYFIYAGFITLLISSLLYFEDLEAKQSKTTPQKSQEEIHYENIKGFYNKRLIQFRKKELDERQYRDSLYVDLETYMIINR